MRSTTSPSSVCTIPSTAPAWICGSAADCRPTRCWPSAWAPGCRWMRCPTSGRPWSACSATTATAGCGQGEDQVPGQRLGSAEVPRGSENEYLKRPLIDGPAPEPVVRPIDHVGVQRLRNGLNAVGVAAIAGRVSGSIPDQGGRPGRTGGLRPDPVHPAPETDRPRRARRPGRGVAGRRSGRAGPSGPPSQWRRNLMACSGIEFCKLSFTQTRVRAQSLVPDLERRLADLNADLDVPVTVHLNGCPNSCADPGRRYRLQRPDHRRGRRPHRRLPGTPGRQPRPGQQLRPKVAPAQGHQCRTGRLHRAGGTQLHRAARAGERFAQWAIRADEESLR